MAYQTYITEALVCGSWNRNTADKSILLFAREAGMVYVQAKSVREERSKQRYALQDASRVRVTLIRGKSGWRVAGAEPLANFYATCDTRVSRAFLRDTILLLRRFMHGEVPHQALFDDVIAALSHKTEYLESLKTILNTRILHTLGYISPLTAHEVFLTPAFPFELVESLTESMRTELEKAIENALAQSQL